jgi:hypothetical protein
VSGTWSPESARSGRTDVVDPIRLGRLASREASLWDDLGDVTAEGDAAGARSGSLRRSHRDRSGGDLEVGSVRASKGRVLDAVGLFEQAIAIAEAVGATDEKAVNQAFLTMAWVDRGEGSGRETLCAPDGMVP